MSDSEQDGNVPSDAAMKLLVQLGEIRSWVRSGDPRADPYLEAGAVKLMPNGEIAFHRCDASVAMTKQEWKTQ